MAAGRLLRDRPWSWMAALAAGVVTPWFLLGESVHADDHLPLSVALLGMLAALAGVRRRRRAALAVLWLAAAFVLAGVLVRGLFTPGSFGVPFVVFAAALLVPLASPVAEAAWGGLRPRGGPGEGGVGGGVDGTLTQGRQGLHRTSHGNSTSPPRSERP